MPDPNKWELIPGDPEGFYTCNGKGRWERVADNFYINAHDLTEEEAFDFYRRTDRVVAVTSQLHPIRRHKARTSDQWGDDAAVDP